MSDQHQCRNIRCVDYRGKIYDRMMQCILCGKSLVDVGISEKNTAKNFFYEYEIINKEEKNNGKTKTKEN